MAIRFLSSGDINGALTINSTVTLNKTNNVINIPSLADNGTFLEITQVGNETWEFKCESLSGSLDGVTIGTTPGKVAFDENGQIQSIQLLDVATAGGRLTGFSNRGYLSSIHLEQTATNTDGGYVRFETAPSGSTTGVERLRITDTGAISVGSTGTNYGSSGQVLTSGGNSNPTWSSPTTGTITGSGTANKVTKFTGASAIGDGPITFATNDSTFAGDILPAAENAQNIGSASVRWEDLYVDDGFIRIAYIDTKIIHTGDDDNFIEFGTDTISISKEATFAGQVNLNNNNKITFDKANTAGGGDFNFIEMGYNGSWSGNQGGIAAIEVNDNAGTVGKYGITFGTGGGKFIVTDLYDGGYGASGDVFSVRGDGLATFAGQVNGIGGNAGAPSYIFEGDDDTGLFHPASNTIAFSTFGNERMRIKSDGNILVADTRRIQFYNTDQYIGAISTNDLEVVAGDDINYRSNFSRFFSGTTEHCRISGLSNQNNWIANGTGGKLGIGLTNPTRTLTVLDRVNIKASSTTGNANLLFGDSGDDGIGQIKYDNSNNSMQFQVNNSIAATILSNGNIGIGYTSPGYSLEIASSGSAGRARVYADGNGAIYSANGDVQLWTNNTAYAINFYSANKAAKILACTNAGSVTVTGDLVAYGSPSDKRLKENIKPIESALDKVEKLQGVTFDWKESDSILDIKEDIGFIAQDVQEVIPELVRENEDGKLSMRHQGVIPILVEAIKEQQKQINKLEEQIKKMSS